MTNMEKVIKGFEICINRVPGEYSCAKCPYEIYGNNCEIQLSKDAVDLIKEQKTEVRIMSEKKLWNIYHCYGRDGGFGDYIPKKDHVGTVEATEEEIKEFLEKWDKPEVYEKPYAALDCHHVYAKPVEVTELKSFEPYSTDPNDWFNLGIREMKEKA